MKCDNCGAAVMKGSGRFCTHCGGVLPDAERISAYEFRTDEARFDEAERHDGFAQAMRHVPEPAQGGAASVIGILVLVFGVFWTIMALSMFPPMALFGIFFIGIAFYGAVYKPMQLARAPLERALAIVVDERTSVSGGKDSTSTHYYATLQLRDGRRCEFSCSGKLAGEITRGDLGVACTKLGKHLLGFARIPV
ncbi:MAG TPA: DUF2500 family protein [Kofleriaceae bacterium]|jgi:hypothetical protein|nr:DUF2500 family protein [Kofleriaceae bacterium]